MTILPDDAVSTAPPVFSRQQMRLDRQARVGILRNPNEPPRLPPRKAALTGKWLDLRSRRRLRRHGQEAGIAEITALPSGDGAPIHAREGRVAAIDVARLMAEAEAHSGGRVKREPFAHGFRGGAEMRGAESDAVAERLRRSLRDVSEDAAKTDAPTRECDVEVAEPPTVAEPARKRFGLRRFLVGLLAGLTLVTVGALAAGWMPGGLR